jgi:hypothetical protein
MSGNERRGSKQAGFTVIFATTLAAGQPIGSGAETHLAEPVPSPRSRPAVVEAVRLPDARPQDAPLPKPNETGNRDRPNETCLERLKSLGVNFSVVAPIAASDGCRLPAPVAIIEIVPGVRLTPDSRLNCKTAEALATWIRDVVLPASSAELGSRPTALIHDSTYVCRPRNGSPDGKLSEHATGNAVDIRAIAFSDRDALPIRIWNGNASTEKRFQARLKKGACRYFSTVLGPGTNAAHASHFHFDLARRKNGYRLCE